MGEALLDLGMERARIGVVGLKGGSVTHCSSIDGVVNHTALAQVMSKLPNATFGDATDVIGLVRYVKSEEEISFFTALGGGRGSRARCVDQLGTARCGRRGSLRRRHRATFGTAQRILSLGANVGSHRHLEAEALHESAHRQAAGKQCLDHQRSERDLGRAVDPGLPADSARQNSRRVETGDRVTEGSLRSGFEIDQTRNHTSALSRTS